MTPVWNALEQRHRQAEIQDQPDLQEGDLWKALRGLERVNFWSGTARQQFKPIEAMARQKGLPDLRQFSMLRPGPETFPFPCGTGPVPGACPGSWKAAIPIPIRSPMPNQGPLKPVPAFASLFMTFSAVPCPALTNVITCSLFLHNLSDDQAVQFLQGSARPHAG